jgi:hypothetical protein
VEIMDRCGVSAAVVCAWHDGFGQTLVEHLRQFQRFPGRFFLFGNIDFSGIDQPDFSSRAVDQLRAGVRAGMRGLKVYKNLGLELRDGSGRLLRVDDRRLDAVWAAAGQLGIPVLIHTADPRAFWEPIGPGNLWGEVLRGEKGWSYYRRGLPGRDELLAERNAVIARHPRTRFIAPHLGSLEDDFPGLAETLDALPNLSVDIAARIVHMARTPARRRAARRFCTDYAGRVLLGTDTILLSEQAPSDIQPQTFYTPDRLPPEFAQGKGTLLATSVWFYGFHRLFLETAKTQRPIPFLTADPSTSVKGLNLPAGVLRKICRDNIARLLGL